MGAGHVCVRRGVRVVAAASEQAERRDARRRFGDRRIDDELGHAVAALQLTEFAQRIVACAVDDMGLAFFDPMRATTRLANKCVGLFEAADVDGLSIPDLYAKAPETVGEPRSFGTRVWDDDRNRE